MKLNIEEIKKLLPHRHPFLLIDSCEIIEKGKIGNGFRKFLNEDYFFQGHFPGNPIVPGVILIESLAQTAGTVISHNISKDNSEKTVLFMSVSNAKFRKPVLPNDEIIFEVKLINNFKSVYKFYGEAKRDSEKICEAVFSAMILEKN